MYFQKKVDPKSKKRGKGERYYSPEYQQAMHNYQKAEKKWSDRYERAQLFVLYVRQNKLKVFLFLVTSITTIGVTVYLVTDYLESMCSKERIDLFY